MKIHGTTKVMTSRMPCAGHRRYLRSCPGHPPGPRSAARLVEGVEFMSLTSLVSYDQVPYQSGSYRLTHPCYLAVLPTLFGVEPPPVRSGRVLELGCASGGNVIPMAQDLPDAEFVGIDLSARQIADGRGLLAELQIGNVELRHASILDVDDSWGKFDFIICHGVYSWVPREVQDKILRIGSRNLRPGGLCYVSYNTYPGWHLRGVVRDMMQYHVASFDDPQTKIDQARSLLDFLNNSSKPRSEAYRRLLADEAEILGRHSDSYLFHEHLEEVNEPLYFHQFVGRVHDAGLEYLAESDFVAMLAGGFDPQTAAILQDAPLLRQQQYLDFLRNRMFRASILCHADAPIDRSVPATRLARCHVTLDERLSFDRAAVVSSETLTATVGHERVTASRPLTKAALDLLNEAWPAALAFEDLVTAAAAKAGMSVDDGRGQAAVPESQRAMLAGDLMTLFTRGLLRLAVDPPSLASAAGATPRVTPLARAQSRRGNLVVNRRHEMVRLADLSRALLLLLDGQHDRTSLLNWLAGAIARGEFRVHREDKPLTDLDDATLTEILDGTLQALSERALLLA
ncbi:MAG: methyltransferase domain-containing protein [Planctomycetaceae bacterium]|nr:MAG: methyltransferase domain-containing protein [Planctomycetaceae bacterium]